MTTTALEPKYVGWKRDGRKGRWQKIAGTEAATFARCYEVLMELCALRGHEPVDQQYQITRIGEVPREKSR